MKLVLGVVDLPYVVETPRRVSVTTGHGTKKKAAEVKSTPASGGETTGDVAEWLEDEYHIMESFFEIHQREIATALEEGLSNVLTALLAGASPSLNAFGKAMDETKILFNHFLDLGEMESKDFGIKGSRPVPTKAALEGYSSRLKSKTGNRRPSFIDTGQYEASFHSEIKD